MEEPTQQHFLLATYAGQGHINPALRLATQLARTIPGARVTFSTSVSGHRRMFPSAASDGEISDGRLSYLPFSDGYDDGFKGGIPGFSDFMAQSKLHGSRNLSNLLGDLTARGRPVTCLIYTILLPWAADVAREHGIRSFLHWIQPAFVFAIYHHYFHGYEDLVASNRGDPLFQVEFPGLPPLRIRDLPSFLTISADDPFYHVFLILREVFETVDREKTESHKPRILVNTFDALESDALSAVDAMHLLPIGPLLPSPEETPSHGDIFQLDGRRYMAWLDSKPEKSVVYVSFGSLSVMRKQQLEEMLNGLEECGRPYLWVVRKDNRGEGVELEKGEKGMVVEWCSQVKVLSHPSVGCFVTHCGWSSMLESLACGVPIVGAPQMSDQGMNAKLAEEAWGTGVRAEANDEGVFEGAELRRCLEVVMGQGEKGAEMRRKATRWRDRVEEAVASGGPSDRNLRAFVEEIGKGA
ncbi:crocetin glucosyltransferase, chloroplastic-like [Phoenix dactylifera]|uniref:Glycosyltransferase n=1 Tax=Phoenix dactylifera TaxID=42345 RepID=A0A8B7C7J1_PHODC|nr:crocetin glucosyltransferase, chloroplastic-like [Phoenix dactylifera]